MIHGEMSMNWTNDEIDKLLTSDLAVEARKILSERLSEPTRDQDSNFVKFSNSSKAGLFNHYPENAEEFIYNWLEISLVRDKISESFLKALTDITNQGMLSDDFDDDIPVFTYTL